MSPPEITLTGKGEQREILQRAKRAVEETACLGLKNAEVAWTLLKVNLNYSWKSKL